MSKLALLCLFLAVTLTVSAPARRPVNVNNNKPKDTKWWDNSKAFLLTSKSFENTVGKEKYVLVQFCATFSKDCEASTPEYDKLALMYIGDSAKRSDVQIARIDGWTFNSLSQELDVRKFPTYRFFFPNDKKRNVEYTGEQNADKINEWIESTIQGEQGKPKEEAAKPTEEKKAEEVKTEEVKKEETKPEEVKKEEVKEETKKEEPKKEEAKQPEAKNNANDQQAQQTDDKKEFKLVLNTTLLQTQFDEVQNQLNKLKEALQQSITDNFQKVTNLEKVLNDQTQKVNAEFQKVNDQFVKVDNLQRSLDGQKTEVTGFTDKLKQHGDKLTTLGTNIASIKDDIHKSVTNYAEGHFSNIKDAVNTIKSKVHEKPIEAPKQESNLMSNMLFMLVGCAVGGIAVFVLTSGGNKKRRSMLD